MDGNRSNDMKIGFTAVILGCFGICRAESSKPDFRTLYINDVSHIAACVSPYHKDGEGLTDRMIEASVDETVLGPAGGSVDVHMLQPCFTWVPWWKSTVCPADEHYKWYYGLTGFPPNKMGIEQYMSNGGDIMATFVRRCRKLGIAPFVSFRLNDHHYKEYADIILAIMNGDNTYKGADFGGGLPGPESCVSRFFLEHREWWLGPDPGIPENDPLIFLHDLSYRSKLRNARSMDWAVPQVRDYVMSLIRELCVGYDIDGLELDFMRHGPYFRSDSPLTAEQREGIMAEFVKTARAVLDAGAKPGQQRWLSVRVPFRMDQYEQMGINLQRFVQSGVDMVNLSCDYRTEQQCDLAKICRELPGIPVFLEFTHTTQTVSIPVKKNDGKQIEQRSAHRIITAEQIYTLANLAYQRGAQGVSAFNFTYSRSFKERESGMPSEPPFYVFKIIRDRQSAARQPQHYFMSQCDLDGVNISRYKAGVEKILNMDMAPPEGGWRGTGRLRLQRKSGRSPNVEIRLNGVPLQPTEDVSEFYPVVNSDALGPATNLQAWTVPADLLRDGVNTIGIKSSTDLYLTYIDLGIQ